MGFSKTCGYPDDRSSPVSLRKKRETPSNPLILRKTLQEKGGQEPNWLTRQFAGGMLLASRNRILVHRHPAHLERLTYATSTAVRCCRTVLSRTESR
jgi:hypothetical protein